MTRLLPTVVSPSIEISSSGPAKAGSWCRVMSPGSRAARALSSMGRIRFSAELAQAVRETASGSFAVGTPMRCGDGHADLSTCSTRSRTWLPLRLMTDQPCPWVRARIERRLRVLVNGLDVAACDSDPSAPATSLSTDHDTPTTFGLLMQLIAVGEDSWSAGNIIPGLALH